LCGLGGAFTSASGARTVAQATPELLSLAQQTPGDPPEASSRLVVLAGQEHCTGEIFDPVRSLPFDLLVPVKSTRHQEQRGRQLPSGRPHGSR